MVGIGPINNSILYLNYVLLFKKKTSRAAQMATTQLTLPRSLRIPKSTVAGTEHTPNGNRSSGSSRKVLPAGGREYDSLASKKNAQKNADFCKKGTKMCKIWGKKRKSNKNAKIYQRNKKNGAKWTGIIWNQEETTTQHAIFVKLGLNRPVRGVLGRFGGWISTNSSLTYWPHPGGIFLRR